MIKFIQTSKILNIFYAIVTIIHTGDNTKNYRISVDYVFFLILIQQKRGKAIQSAMK